MPKTIAFSIEFVLCRRFFLWIPNVTTKPVHFPLRTECAVYEISGRHLVNFWKAGSIVFFLCVLLHWWIGHQQMGSGKTSLERTFADFTTSRFPPDSRPLANTGGRGKVEKYGWRALNFDLTLSVIIGTVGTSKWHDNINLRSILMSPRQVKQLFNFRKACVAWA